MTQHFFHEVFFFFIVFNIVLPTSTFSTTTLCTIFSRTIKHHDKIGIIQIFMSLICFPYFSCNAFLVACFCMSRPHYDPKSCSSPWNPFFTKWSYRIWILLYYMVLTVTIEIIYILCMLNQSVSFSEFIKTIHILYVVEKRYICIKILIKWWRNWLNFCYKY